MAEERPVKEKAQEITADLTLAERREYYRKIIADLTIMSDVFARNVLKEKRCTEYLLETILGEKRVMVLDQVIQMDYKNLQGRSAVLDCVARDQKNRIINVEIQNENEGATPKRARYHSGLVDMNTLYPGQDFDDLPEKYIIFITQDDVLKRNKPLYHIQRKIDGTKELFKDEEHILYVNSKMQDDTKLGRLMHDLHCRNADEMYSQILAERVRMLKETKGGIEIMCKEMEALYNQGILNGEKLGEKRGIELGETAMAKLFEKLLNMERHEDCQRVIRDEAYRKLLMEELNI